MAFNEVFRLRIYQSLQSAQVVNVLHFVQDDPLPSRGGLELANDFVTNLTTSLKARAFTGVAFQYIEVQSIVPFSGASIIVNFPGGTIGGVSGNCASGSLAEVVTIYSERAGRRGRGRFYLPPGGTNATEAVGGLWTAAQTTRTQTFATALTTRYIAAAHPIGWVLGVWSRASGPEFPPWTTSQFAKGSGLVVRPTIRNQRRRQVGVGR